MRLRTRFLSAVACFALIPLQSPLAQDATEKQLEGLVDILHRKDLEPADGGLGKEDIHVGQFLDRGGRDNRHLAPVQQCAMEFGPHFTDYTDLAVHRDITRNGAVGSQSRLFNQGNQQQGEGRCVLILELFVYVRPCNIDTHFTA